MNDSNELLTGSPFNIFRVTAIVDHRILNASSFQRCLRSWPARSSLFSVFSALPSPRAIKESNFTGVNSTKEHSRQHMQTAQTLLGLTPRNWLDHLSAEPPDRTHSNCGVRLTALRLLGHLRRSSSSTTPTEARTKNCGNGLRVFWQRTSDIKCGSQRTIGTLGSGFRFRQNLRVIRWQTLTVIWSPRARRAAAVTPHFLAFPTAAGHRHRPPTLSLLLHRRLRLSLHRRPIPQFLLPLILRVLLRAQAQLHPKRPLKVVR
jgi:hypothetical protein